MIDGNKFARCAIGLVVAVAVASPVLAQNEWVASKSEGVQLPQFCWGQMLQIKDGPPSYYIPDCGPFANHFCLGLLKIVRANKLVGNLPQKKYLYASGKYEAEQFLKLTQNEPKCPAPIRQHAQSVVVQMDQRLKLLR